MKDKKQKLIAENVEDLMSEFEAHFKILQDNDELEIIDYDANVLDHIVEIDMYNKPPFILENKKSIRDAIIWYSYMIFIKKNELEDCYFISNNHKEFGAEGTKQIKEGPYPLHPNIADDTNITAYKNIYDFLTHDDAEIQTFYDQLISDRVLENINDELENGLVEEIIKEYFIHDIESQTDSFISNLEVDRIHEDFIGEGFASPIDVKVTRISLNDVEVYGDDITISVDIEVEQSIEIYLYNPGHFDKNDKYKFCAMDTLRIIESVIFIIHFDIGKVTAMKDFSLKEYIRDNEPRNLDIDFISLGNIDHEDMYVEEDYIYDFE